MPSNEYIKLNSISVSSQQPHTRRRKNRSSAFGTSAGDISVKGYLFTSAEAFDAGVALSLDENGKLVVASNVAEDLKDARFISLEMSLAADAQVYVTDYGIVSIPEAEFVINSEVFLAADGALTTTKPTDTSGNLIQILGTAISATQFAVNIHPAMKIA